MATEPTCADDGSIAPCNPSCYDSCSAPPCVGICGPTPVCTEDMDCWDCSTMGNMICGTISHDDSSNYLPNTGFDVPIATSIAIILILFGRLLRWVGKPR